MNSEKKFLCDYEDKIFGKWLFIIVGILCIIGGLISSNFASKGYEKEVATITDQDYTYLEEVANNICDKENKALHLSDIPSNVTISDIALNEESIEFSCRLNDKDFNFASNPVVTVKVIKDYSDVHISQIRDLKTGIIIICSLLSILFVLMITLLFLIIFIIAFNISFKNKCKYLNSKLKKINCTHF